MSSASVCIDTRRDARHPDLPPPPKGVALMLRASVSVGLLDRYRVPYSVVADDARNGFYSIGRNDGTGPRLIFMRAPRNADGTAYRFEGVTLYVQLPDRAAVSAALDMTGHTWREDAPIVDFNGVRKSSLSRDRRKHLPAVRPRRSARRAPGGTLPPAGGGGPLARLARGAYYRAKPLLPDSVRLALRRLSTSPGASRVSSLADRDLAASARGAPSRLCRGSSRGAVALDCAVARAVRLVARPDP